MLMRRTIGISVAFLVISTGAMASPPDKTTSHHPDHPCAAKSQRTAQHSSKSHVVSIKPSGSRARSARYGAATRYRQAATRLAAHHDDAAAPPQLLGGREIGTAAWYNHVGARTSSGERLDTVTLTAAHRTLPLASYARVTHLDTGRSVIVKINDRGPWTRRFIIDLSPRAADELHMRGAGVAAVAIEPVTQPTEAVGTTVVTRSSSALVTQ
jgi:rare lipoprotein A (peptidoglycan hydrolase)